MSMPAIPGPASWAVELLRCPACRQVLAEEADALRCTTCGCLVGVDRGVVDGLAEAHPAVLSEQQAVAALDSGEAVLPIEGPTEDAAEAWQLHVDRSRLLLQQVLDASPLRQDEVVVELGADNCWASQLFLDAGCRVVAVDITDHLHLAEAAHDPNLCRLQADMNAIPVADGSADVVWATAAAHHSWDLAQTFREAARVLRPGGRLAFCCEPMPSWLRWPFGLSVGDDERALGIHETWVPRWRWLRLAHAAGFDAELVFPTLDDEQTAERLRARSLPVPLIPLATALARPVLRTLQVSIHLVGRLTARS